MQNTTEQNPMNTLQTKFTDLSYDLLHEIFDYLSLGDIYYSFYHVNDDFSRFIDTSYTCLNVCTMTFRHFDYYRENILKRNVHHRRKIKSIKLSTEKSFDQIDEFLSRYLSFYQNLKTLYLCLRNENYLQHLPNIVPNLSELYLTVTKEKFSNINWLSQMKNLEICSITPQNHGIEISNTMQSLSKKLSSLSITLSSTYDFYTLLPLLSRQSIRCLNVSLFDSEFSYIKTFKCPLTLATKLTDFIFDLSLVPIRDASSLYNVIQFVTNSLRFVEKLTIYCRFADGIQLEEEQFRHYLSFAYSVKKFEIFIEMNNLSNINENLYAYPFWINKNVHVNVYQNRVNKMKSIRIYTLPLSRKIINLFGRSEEIERLNKCSTVSNIYQFDLDNSSDIPLLFRSSHLSTSLSIESELDFFLHSKLLRNIRHLQLNPILCQSFDVSRKIFQQFPRLRSISINEVNEYETMAKVLDRFLFISSNRQSIMYLHVSGSFFDDICLSFLTDEEVRNNFKDLFPSLYKRNESYTMKVDHRSRCIDFWF